MSNWRRTCCSSPCSLSQSCWLATKSSCSLCLDFWLSLTCTAQGKHALYSKFKQDITHWGIHEHENINNIYDCVQWPCENDGQKSNSTKWSQFLKKGDNMLTAVKKTLYHPAWGYFLSGATDWNLKPFQYCSEKKTSKRWWAAQSTGWELVSGYKLWIMLHLER